MTSLKKSGLLRTYYRDRLRGYRLGAKAKAALLDGWPERFSSYLTGDTDTNRLKSEVNRRLRLYRLAETYVTMDNAGIGLFQDEKPKVFSPQGSIPSRERPSNCNTALFIHALTAVRTPSAAHEGLHRNIR